MAAAIAVACSISCATRPAFTDNRRLDYAKLFIGLPALVEKRGYAAGGRQFRVDEVTGANPPIASLEWQHFF